MFESVINQIFEKYNWKDFSRKQIINDLFQNDFLKQKFVNEIRRATTVWILSNEIFKRLWIQDECKIMAIWDIQYFSDIKEKWLVLVKKSLNEIDSSKLFMYDMNGQGSDELSTILYNYMSLYYDFSWVNYDIKSNIIPCYGSTDWLVMILDTFRQKYSWKKVNFIFPEASFMASISIAKSYWFDLVKFDKAEKNNFFISSEQIKNYYDSKKEGINIYYFTPVWNPTWEKIRNDDLIDLMKYIIEFDRDAVFILDNVYVWLLKKEVSNKMFSIIFQDKELHDRVIFCESLSKTLWTTWMRLAWIWTINEENSGLLKKNIILKKAWFSKILDQFAINLLSNLEEINNFQQKEFDFISGQRINFISFIKENFSEYFVFDSSSSVNDREWIYVLLKLKDWYDAKSVFAETQIIWVPMTLSDWDYIRYSFWNTNYF